MVVPIDQEIEVSLLSYCKIDSNCDMEFVGNAAELQLLLVLKNASLSLVMEEKYKHHLSILGLF